MKQTKKVQITLELNERSIKMIEKMSEEKIKELLEKEINENPESFIETMGYDNF